MNECWLKKPIYYNFKIHNLNTIFLYSVTKTTNCQRVILSLICEFWTISSLSAFLYTKLIESSSLINNDRYIDNYIES